MIAAAALFAALAVAAPPAAPSPAPAPPQHIASLNLAADEILADIVPPARLAAVTSLVDEKGTSNAIGRIPASVPRLKRADLERLVALHPDLVIVSEYTDADFLHALASSGLRVHRMTGLSTFAGYRAALLALGEAVGERAAAERLAARYDAVLAELARRLASVQRRPRVLYWASSLTAGGDTAIGALIEAAGGVNVGRELRLSGMAQLGAERAFVSDPDAILIGEGWGSRETLKSHPMLSQMRAVREERILDMPTELLVALDHHAADAAWALAHLLHPDAVPARLPDNLARPPGTLARLPGNPSRRP